MRIPSLSFLVFPLLLCTAARAELVEYVYTGAPFDTSTGTAYGAGDHISGSFVIDDADMVSVGSPGTVVNITSDIVSFAFSDGSSGPFPATIEDGSAIPPTNLRVYTDANGNIVQWDMFVTEDVDRWMSWCNTGDGCTGSGLATRDVALNRISGNSSSASTTTPGTWSKAAAFPIPPATGLLLAAAGGLVAVRALGRSRRLPPSSA